MRVSWKWLNSLVAIKETPEELARLMTMSGVAVDTIAYLNKGIEKVAAGRIEEVRPHQKADKLWICRVFTGKETLTIITGAANVEEGQKVPVALEGAVLAGGKRIKKTTIRGVDSEGMLCSAEELGLDIDKLPPEQKDGIYILTPEVEPGEDIVTLLNLDDAVFELDLTPNRADCLSMINVAREVAALTGSALHLPEINASKKGSACAAMTSVRIEDADLCRRYTARMLKDIRIGPSPLWMQCRLMAAGIRPVNNIVDITNYVMLETGQPLHAFDYDRLEEKRIIVRRAKLGETLVTLDGQQRELSPEMLIIADARQPVGLAGVMGGLATEVTAATKTILLEAAYFDGPCIRRTSHALGLRSEASQRFEKGVEIEQTTAAADRAIQLMAELGAGTVVDGHIDVYPSPGTKYPVALRLDRVNRLLGTEITAGEVEKILKDLRIKVVDKDAERWLVVAPSYRRDIEIEADLIEEIARLYGYDRIPTTLPFGATTQGIKTREQRIREKAAEVLSAQGLYEIITYSFINPRHLDWLRIAEEDILRDFVTVRNPLSEEQGIMRTTLLPGLLETVRKNLNKRSANLALYEIGKVYFSQGFPEEKELPLEKWALAAVVTGVREKTWAYNGLFYDFFYLKGVITNLLKSLGLQGTVFRKAPDISWLHPGRAAVLSKDEHILGYLGEVHPLVREKYDIDQRACVALLDLDLLSALAKEGITYRPAPKYPAVARDLAVIMPDGIEAADVMAAIEKTGGELLQEVRLFDVYKGKQVADGYKSLAFSLTWQSDEKTMTDEEVNDLHREIVQSLNRDFGAELRKA